MIKHNHQYKVSIRLRKFIISICICIIIFTLEGSVSAASLSDAVEEITAAIGPGLKGKALVIGPFLQKNTQNHLAISDLLAEEVGKALNKRGVKVIFGQKKYGALQRDWIKIQNPVTRIHAAKKIGTRMDASKIGIGTFKSLGTRVRVSFQIVDSLNGSVSLAKTVNIDNSSIPIEVLDPLLHGSNIVSFIQGTKIKSNLNSRGEASISRQCDIKLRKKNSCPSDKTLKERAIRKAKLKAMQKMAKQLKVKAWAFQQIFAGLHKPEDVKLGIGKILKTLQFDRPSSQGDTVSIVLRANIK